MNIGVFDSGVGGLTMLAKLVNLYPSAHFYYRADNANAPFGNQSERQLLQILTSAFEYFQSVCADIVVVACNTCSLLLDKVEQGISTVGIVPPLDLLVKADNPILFATPFTLSKLNQPKHVRAFGIADLAPTIEQYALEPTEETEQKILSMLPDVQTDLIGLGCTHYPLVSKIFYKKYGCPQCSGQSKTIEKVKQLIGTSQPIIGSTEVNWNFTGAEHTKPLNTAVTETCLLLYNKLVREG